MSRPTLSRLQARVFALTWLSYGSYYLTRKNVSIVKSSLEERLGVGTAALSHIDTLYNLCYAVGQFGSGALSDRLGPRRMIALGMAASGLMALWFGLSSSVLAFALAFGCNGFFQSTGWPNNVKAMQPWFDRRTRGRVMGLWSTNYQAGGLAATLLATRLLVLGGWRLAFYVPALLVALCGGAVLLFLVERPQDAGLPAVDPDADSAPLAAERPGGRHDAGLRRLLRSPVLWLLGGAYFGLKLIRYSLLFWLPYYLHRHLHFDKGSAGYLSTAFEAGGIAGAISIGWLSDRYFPGRRIRVALPALLGLAGALWLYQRVGAAGAAHNAIAMALVGFFLFGPDTLISGAAAQDLGGSRATGSVAGFINGLGSLGAVLQGYVTHFVSQRYGWDALFRVFVGIALGSTLLLLPLVVRREDGPPGRPS